MAYVLSTAWILPGKTNRLREWYAELKERRKEALQTMDNEGVRQEAAFILPTEHGDLLAVFIEVDDMDAANTSFFASPFALDHTHAEVMDECTTGGVNGRISAELMYVFQNPRTETSA